MMRYFLILSCLLLNFAVQSSAVVVFPDSVGAQVVEGKKMIIHRVEPKETWYSVSRKYGVPVKTIQDANPGVQVLQIGETIHVPASKRLVKSSTVLGASPVKEEAPIVKADKVAPPRERVADPVQSAQPGEIHVVEAGETMFSISKKYSITVADLKRWNNIEEGGLKVGQKLHTYGPATGSINKDQDYAVNKPVQKEPRETKEKEDEFPIPAVVQPGKKPVKEQKKIKQLSLDPWERIESLADTVTPGKPKVDTTKGKATVPPLIKRNATPVAADGKPVPNFKEQLAKIIASSNASYKKETPPQKKLSSKDSLAQVIYLWKRDSIIAKGGNPDVLLNQPKPGEEGIRDKQGRLILTAPPKKPVFETPNLEPAGPVPSVVFKAKKDSVPKSLKETIETGTASWINDEQVNANKFYALHRNATIGTIIKVTNINNRQSVFVKVVGSLPETGDNSNLIIKISRAAAKKLGVTESKFQAELSYGTPGK